MEHDRRPTVTWLVLTSLLVAGVIALGVRSLGTDGSGDLVASIPDPESVFDPTRAGEELPTGYRQLLHRDDIAPVYEPLFTSPDRVHWPEDSLVIGVAGAETAKAYPVTFLNQREMVNDEIEGLPILVSW